MYFNGSDFSNFRVGGGATTTTLSPITLLLMLLALGLILMLPRKLIVIPLVFTWIFIPFGEQVYVVGVHLFVSRILTLFCGVRVAMMDRSSKTEFFVGGFGLIDKLFFGWAICRVMATCLLIREVQTIVNQVGFLIDTLAAYILLRLLIRDDQDILRVLKTLAVLVCIFAVTMTVESLRGSNLFSYLGGQAVPELRDGRIRAQGPFAHAIRAGTFGATLLCMNIWLWRSGKLALAGLFATIGSVVVVFTSASSTPLMALAAAGLGICMWPLRNCMRMVRWGIVLFLIALQLAMKVPFWWAINHIDLVGGNSSYHRAAIVDAFIRHFADWWAIGVKSTAAWGWDMWDSANQFVAEGQSGGLVTFAYFVLLISRTFGRIGAARRIVRGDRDREWFFWLLGCTLFSFVVSFFGISFTDQAIDSWLVLFAISAATTAQLPALAHHSEQSVENRQELEPDSDIWAFPKMEGWG